MLDSQCLWISLCGMWRAQIVGAIANFPLKHLTKSFSANVRRNTFPRIINLSTFNNIEIDIHLAELTLLTQSAHLLLYWLIWNGVKAKFTLINSFTFVVIEMKIENFITCAEIWLNLAIKRMIWNCISLLRRKLATTNTWITTSSSMHSRISVSSKPTITLHDHVMSEKFASSSDKNKYTISRF